MDPRKNNGGSERILPEGEKLLEEINAWLREEEGRDAVLRAAILSSRNDRVEAISGLEKERIFHEPAIRSLCVRYRLRFLPGAYFKGHIPSEALVALRRAEARAGRPLQGFVVLAPARLFRLGDCNADPALFIRISKDQYYLVHRWGRALSRRRAIQNWPLRTAWHLVATLFVLAMAIAAMVPSAVFDPASEGLWWSPVRLLFLFWVGAVLAASTTFGWFAFHGRFSAEAWRSHTFN